MEQFLQLTTKHDVRMLMVGGGAVNFHGYQRHSVDVNFWIDTSEENLNRLLSCLRGMDYEIDNFPEEVKIQQQNISIKFSPTDLDIELITRFNINKTFEEAYQVSEEISISGNPLLKYNVLSYDDLITSKIKSNRPKDQLDIIELERIHKKEE